MPWSTTVDLKDAKWFEFRSYTNGPMEADLANMVRRAVLWYVVVCCASLCGAAMCRAVPTRSIRQISQLSTAGKAARLLCNYTKLCSPSCTRAHFAPLLQPDQGIKFAPLLSLHIFDCLGVSGGCQADFVSCCCCWGRVVGAGILARMMSVTRGVEAGNMSQEAEILMLVAAPPPPLLQVAWGRHETIGEYMTAALVWLENRGQVDIAEVAARFRVPHLTDLQVDAATLSRRR